MCTSWKFPQRRHETYMLFLWGLINFPQILVYWTMPRHIHRRIVCHWCRLHPVQLHFRIESLAVHVRLSMSGNNQGGIAWLFWRKFMNEIIKRSIGLYAVCMWPKSDGEKEPSERANESKAHAWQPFYSLFTYSCFWPQCKLLLPFERSVVGVCCGTQQRTSERTRQNCIWEATVAKHIASISIPNRASFIFMLFPLSMCFGRDYRNRNSAHSLSRTHNFLLGIYNLTNNPHVHRHTPCK